MIHRQRFYPDPDYVPKAYGYCRVSHKQQLDKGASVADQEYRIKRYYEMQARGPLACVQWGGFYSEPLAQSAYKKPLKMRPKGGELMEILQPSDHIIIDKQDRIIRDNEDWQSLDRHFTEHGIYLHIINLGGQAINSTNAFGKFMLSMFASVAELESTIKGERVRDARARARAQKRHAGTGIPSFCEVVGAADGKLRGSGGRLVFKKWAETVFVRIKQYVSQNLSWYEIGKRMADEFKLIEKRPERWEEKAKHYYWFWEAWNAGGRPDINEIKVNEFIATYKRSQASGKMQDV